MLLESSSNLGLLTCISFAMVGLFTLTIFLFGDTAYCKNITELIKSSPKNSQFAKSLILIRCWLWKTSAQSWLPFPLNAPPQAPYPMSMRTHHSFRKICAAVCIGIPLPSCPQWTWTLDNLLASVLRTSFMTLDKR